MKRILLALSTLTTFAFTNAQIYSPPELTGGSMEMGYSTDDALLASFNAELNNKFIVGFNLSLFKKSTVYGTSYSTEIISPSEFKQDIYGLGYAATGIEFRLGQRITENFSIIANLGWINVQEYQNRYDRLHILGANGQYNIQLRNSSNHFRGGIDLTYDVSRYVSLTLGYMANHQSVRYENPKNAIVMKIGLIFGKDN